MITGTIGAARTSESHIPETTRQLLKLNASYRFRIFAPTFVDNELTGKPKQIDSGRVECDIFDITVGELYATGKGSTEKEAFEKAIALAIQAEKPMTPAQKADREARREIADKANMHISSLTRENEDLKKRIAELEASTAARKPSRRDETPKPD